jgi:hypothetical protein
MKTLTLSRMVFAALVSIAADAAAASDAVQCGDYMDDAAALKTAPRDAQRHGPHVLTVTHQAGVKRFANRPPYQEAFGGAHWYYCGFVPALRAHLVGKNEEDLFSGVLLLDDTGEMVDAGQSVLPSVDGEMFQAERQVSGEDGSRWRVATRSGTTLWDGYAGVLRTVTEQPGGPLVEHIVMSFETPSWNGRMLKASAVCANAPQTKGVATFSLDGGRWEWRTSLTCVPVDAASR